MTITTAAEADLAVDIEGDRVRSIDQFVGDPSAVTAFWD
jgi:hypothetical protein